MRSKIWLSTAILLAVPVFAQQGGLLRGGRANEVFSRTVQLMESTSAASPELSRAGAPITENARQAFNLIRENPNNSIHTHTFLANARAYLALSDAVPKPYPFPEEAGRQLAELRERVNETEAHFRALLAMKEAQLRNPDRDNLRRYADANAKVGPPVEGRQRVVFYGDSITDGWRINEYFPERDFINRGISGQITGEMLGRMKADVIDLKPAAMIILAGTNDIARGVALETIENNLVMIAQLAEANRIKPIFASVLPISDYHKDKNPSYEMSLRRPPKTILALNQWLQSFCRQRNYTYVDYFTAMVDQAGYLKAELADDGLHPNSAGYRVMAPLALSGIDKTVGGGAARTSRKR